MLKKVIVGLVALASVLGATSRLRAETITATAYVYQARTSDNFGGGTTPMWNNGVLGSPGHNDGLTPGQIAIVNAAYNPTYAQVASSLDTTPPKTFAGALANAMATYSVSASSINYASPPASYTVPSFTGATPVGQTSSLGTYSASASLDNTVIVLDGTITLTHGEYITLSSDDGSSLYLNGSTTAVIDMSQPQGNSLTTYQYLGSTGTIAFDLIYGEVNGSPADLSLTTSMIGPAVVPEPASMAMVAFGLIAVGGYSIRRRKLAVA